MKTMQLYLVTGFLGAGKTTFLRNVLMQTGTERIGVIVNEFGSIGIDGKLLQDGSLKLVEINNGSIFCSCLKAGFVNTLAAFLSQEVDTVYVEASGMADPSSIEMLLDSLQPILERKKIAGQYIYRGSICIVDCLEFWDVCDILQSVTNQVKKSSLLVINKTDLVHKEHLDQLHETLFGLNPKAIQFDTTYCKVPVALLEGTLPAVQVDGESTNTTHNRPACCILEMPGHYDPDKVVAFCRAFGKPLLRCKGFFHGLEHQVYHLDGVGNEIYAETAGGDPSPESLKLVLLGLEGTNLYDFAESFWVQLLPGIPSFFLD